MYLHLYDIFLTENEAILLFSIIGCKNKFDYYVRLLFHKLYI